jgi:hypothetical protein
MRYIATAGRLHDSITIPLWDFGGHLVDTLVDGGLSACLNSPDKSIR